MKDKWYSNGFDCTTVIPLIKQYGKITNSFYPTIWSKNTMKLELILENGAMTATTLELFGIQQLLGRTKKSDVTDLRGTVIETYWNLNGRLECISINENLI